MLSTNAVNIVAEKDILVPDLDKRKYRYLLLTNKVKVLLISDAEADKCAACCCVEVGSMQDPPEAQGLAHFLEHMLFMGTEKFPEENEYSAYLNRHGGYSNAYTDSEQTVYYFDVLNDHFEGALDRFSAFFTCPLFAEASTDREINAVDSENSKNLQSDMWRKFQLFKSLARPDHPINSFSTGNKETLGDAPKAAGTNIRDMMMAFYKKYYSANLMSVTIYGNTSLDQLQEWAVNKFSNIPNHDFPHCVYPSDPFRPEQLRRVVEIAPVRDTRNVELYFPMPAVESLYRSKPAKTLAHLIGHESDGSILAALKKKVWANELSAFMYRSSHDFSVFGVEIKLTDQGLEHVQEVVAAVFSYVGMLLQKGIEDWVWDELKDIGEMKFRFKDKREPSDDAVNLATSMDTYAPTEVIAGDTLLFEKNMEKTRELLQLIRPENALVFLIHKGATATADKKERWYGTDYSERAFSTVEEEQWQKALECSLENDWASLLHLPKPNPFVPTDFTIKGSNIEDEMKFPHLVGHECHPGARIHLSATSDISTTSAAESAADKDSEVNANNEDHEDEDEGDEDDEEASVAVGSAAGQPQYQTWNEVLAGNHLVLWHRLDAHWHSPKAVVQFVLESQFASATPWNVVMTDLLGRIWTELLSEFAYYADCAGLHYDQSVGKSGLVIRFEGYNHKLSVLVERAFEELRRFAEVSSSEAGNVTFNPALFERVKDSLSRAYKNQLFNQPYFQSMIGAFECLEDPRWGLFEKIQSLAHIGLDSLRSFARQFLSQLCFEVFANGNITAEEATAMVLKAQSTLQATHLPYSLQALRRPVQLQTGKHYVYRQSGKTYNPNEVNSASCMMFLFGEEIGNVHNTLTNEEECSQVLEQALMLQNYRNLFVRMMSEPAFDQLRTKEQLGYIVYVTGHELAQRMMTVSIIVQSSVQDPVYLDSRVEAFLEQYRTDILEKMEESKLQTFIDAEVESLLEKPKNLDQETRWMGAEVTKGTYLFDRPQRLAAMLRKEGLFTVEKMLACFDQFFGKNSASRTSFSSQLFGKNRAVPTKQQVLASGQSTNVVIVDDVMEFKRQLPLLPIHSYLPKPF